MYFNTSTITIFVWLLVVLREVNASMLLFLSELLILLHCRLLSHKMHSWSIHCVWCWSKVINPKYSKHLPYGVAHTIDSVCSKMLSYGVISFTFQVFWMKIIHSKLNKFRIKKKLLLYWELRVFYLKYKLFCQVLPAHSYLPKWLY